MTAGASNEFGLLTVRVPTATLDTLDRIANLAGLSRATLVRLVLNRVSESDVPAGLIEHGDELRAARVLR